PSPRQSHAEISPPCNRAAPCATHRARPKGGSLEKQREGVMASTVLVCGVISAVLAGVADFFAALVSRKLGSFLTLLYMIAGSAVVLVLAQVLSARAWAISATDSLVLFLVAGAALVGYLAF